ncbi:MAG: class I SAM-dependent methyltransferase, partial [Mycobacteriaceae bacterium]|nr:class I SAM-dependent methyltransferase [Mycobacteriaceae bacterium]
MESPDTLLCIRCGAPSRGVVVPHDRHGSDLREVRLCSSAVCGVGFTWPPPDELVEAAPAAGELRGIAARVAAAMAAASVAPLADALRPGALVVDVGAGTGLRARALADRGFRVIAMEPDPMEEMRAHVELTGTSAEIHLAGVDDIGGVLDGREADAVLMWHVLEHLEMPDIALAEVSGVMRDG